jgi:DHA1 family multidrug resistance protein-like MFS transporter
MPVNKNIVILLVGLFSVIVGFGITLPVLSFYIKDLSQAMDISFQNLWLLVGLITQIYPFKQFLLSPYLGSLPDRLRGRPLILYGLLGYSFSMFFFAISGSIPLLYILC